MPKHMKQISYNQVSEPFNRSFTLWTTKQRTCNLLHHFYAICCLSSVAGSNDCSRKELDPESKMLYANFINFMIFFQTAAEYSNAANITENIVDVKITLK